MSDSADWRRDSSLWSGTAEIASFDVAESALIIVDMQRYWTEPEGPTGKLLHRKNPVTFEYFYKRMATVAIPSITSALTLYRNTRSTVVHFTFGPSREDFSDLSLRRHREFRKDGQFRHLRVGGEWHRITGALSPQPGEIILNKISNSGFNSTNIDQLLRNLHIETLLICGFSTNGCVELTARDAADRGYRTFLLEEGCVTFTPEEHKAALCNFQGIYGDVIGVRELTTTPPASKAEGQW